MSRNGGAIELPLHVRIGRPADDGALPASPCPFCPPTGAQSAVRSPAELVRLAADAGVNRLRLSAATPIGLTGLAEYVTAVRSGVPDLRVSVDCYPPENYAFEVLAAAGVTEVGVHIGSLDEDVRARGYGGVTLLPLARYERAWDEAVRAFGRYRVSTCLVVGAGENPGDLVAGAARLIARGVHPIVVPYQAGADALVRWLGQAVADMLRTVGASVTTQQPIGPTTGWGMR